MAAPKVDTIYWNSSISAIDLQRWIDAPVDNLILAHTLKKVRHLFSPQNLHFRKLKHTWLPNKTICSPRTSMSMAMSHISPVASYYYRNGPYVAHEMRCLPDREQGWKGVSKSGMSLLQCCLVLGKWGYYLVKMDWGNTTGKHHN